MSAVLSVPAIWRTDKIMAVTGHTRHRHSSSPISAGFQPPNANTTLQFGPSALAASIARTGTLRDAPPEMLARWGDSALTEVEWLVDNGTTFALSRHVYSLADVERTSFAGRIGAGVTDLLMNALGYAWRDNAARLSCSLAPHADFIYAGGAVSGHGVVLAEAHGSFAANVTSSSIGRHARRKYLRQVSPYLAVISPHGKVVHGYSIAVGSTPGTAGAFLHVAETAISKPRGRHQAPTQSPPMPGPPAVPTSLALSSHRSNFSLMDAPKVARWIDWIRHGGERPDDTSAVTFIKIPYAGRTFLASVEAEWFFAGYADWLDEIWHPRWWPRLWRGRRPQRDGDEFAGWFVMEEKSAEQFLNSLSAIIRNGRDNVPGLLELPEVEPVGFAIRDEDSGQVIPTPDYTSGH